MMDNFIDKKMPRAILITLLIMAPLFSFDEQSRLPELYLCITIYILLQYFRDFIFKLNLDNRKGLFFLVGQLVLLSVIISLDQSFISQVFLLILIGEMVYHHTLNYSIPFAVAAYLFFVAGKWIAFGFPPLSNMSFIIPRITEFLVVFVFSYLVKISMFQKKQLEKAYDKMKTASLKLEENIIMQERKRFAREMHDSIGHSFSTSLIGLNAVKTLIHQDPNEAQQLLNQVYQNLESGLHEVRKSVRELQGNHFFIDFQNAVEALLEETKQQTDVDIHVEMNVAEGWLNPRQEIVIYRALQEGLTNGLRHGKASLFSFQLSIVDDTLQFSLSDNGRGSKNIEQELGFGLIAMKERVEETGGTIIFQSNNTRLGGIDILIELPKDKNVHKIRSVG
ncbi:sensor histidine kinase [Gracilibacillus lacisalsi]|uniref:sensor histidine kinase n=1 Tax=Gracilibacillus lacisalsi TaxID=393087 RepID=UPI00037E3DBF|nr:sensor histidine kinase [Gracilibacillus lacisalsi]